MEVPRVPPIGPVDTGLPATGERPAGGGGDLPFGPGQKLFAQVVQVLGEGRARSSTSAASACSPRRRCRSGPARCWRWSVRGVGAVVELDIEAPPVAFSERAYALAAVRQALQQSAPAAPLTSAELEVLAHALERANWGGGPAACRRAIGCSRCSARCRCRATPRRWSMRSAIASPRAASFFEGHAARALADGARDDGAARDLQTDIRWLLAALGPRGPGPAGARTAAAAAHPRDRDATARRRPGQREGRRGAPRRAGRVRPHRHDGAAHGQGRRAAAAPGRASARAARSR